MVEDPEIERRLRRLLRWNFWVGAGFGAVSLAVVAAVVAGMLWAAKLL